MKRAVTQELKTGERVTVLGMLEGEGEFVRYGPPSSSCPPNHMMMPSCRIVYVKLDSYPRKDGSAVWENRVRRADGSMAYEAVEA